MLVLLFVASLLVLPLLVLVLTIRPSKGKHLSSTRSRSHPRKAQIEVSSSESSSCQTCHMCGGLRLRLSNADDAKSSQLHSLPHFAVPDHVPHVRSRPPREHWASMKTQISLSIKQVVQKFISHQRKQTQGEFLRRLASSSNFSRQKSFSELKAMCVVPACVSTVECSSAESCADSHLGGIVSNAISNVVKSEFAVTSIGTSSGIPSPEASSTPAVLDRVQAQGTQGAADIDAKGAPVHRLVLEILVSPSENTDGRSESSCPTSASGLKLKLATNSRLEHLAGCAETLKSKAKKCEHSVNVPQVMCLSRDVLSKASGSPCTFEDQASQILDEALLVPDAGISCSEKLKSALLDTKLTSRECCDGSQMAGLKDCGQSCRSFHDNMEGESIKGTALCGAAGKHSTVMGQLKFRIGNHTCKNVVSDAVSKSSIEVKESMLGSEVASVVPLNGLGSLRITLLKSDAQGEGTEKANSQVGSPLASLNVAGKPNGGLGSSNPRKENKSFMFSDSSCNLSPKSAARVGQGAAIVCEQNLVEREDHSCLQALTDTSSNSSSRKEKKKKKNKGKKLKAKTGAVVADAQEMQEIGKIALEAAKHVSAVPEREIGCVCGASKGDLHSETCPYPFTSSGSMLQRKIKEQYNHLVRSNAAKTLTLAQVGQFTSCLVEAKATLQQKSESIQRKFTITKSLLSKADKSSFDRLCGQIYGLEMEQKKLEEDTVVYNRLQEQLKLSPAYKKMLEYGRAHFELQPHTGQMIEKLEPEDSEMSFEELLAQEKKDAFWQRHSLARSAVSAS